MKSAVGRGSMNRSCRRPSPRTRRPSPLTTGCPTGRIVFFSELAARPINQPFCARSGPGFCAPEYVRSTTESKPMPSFAAGRVLTNTTCPGRANEMRLFPQNYGPMDADFRVSRYPQRAVRIHYQQSWGQSAFTSVSPPCSSGGRIAVFTRKNVRARWTSKTGS